jgi:hypothetical protein
MIQIVSQNGSTYVFLADPTVPDYVDFVGSTVAVSTQCTPITGLCHMTAPNNIDESWQHASKVAMDSIQKRSLSVLIQGNMSFSCSSGFAFDSAAAFTPIGTSSLIWQLSYFEDRNLSIPVQMSNTVSTVNSSVRPASLDSSTSSSEWTAVVPNPVYFGLASVMDINGQSTDYPLYNDSEIVHGDGGIGDGFILSCTTAAYDATYTWINGSFGNFTSLSFADTMTMEIINTRFLDIESGLPVVGLLQLINNAGVACLANSSIDLANIIASAYSQASLGGAAGAFVSTANLNEWTGNPVLLSRIPFAPLYVLATLTGIFAVMALLLGIVGCVNISATRWIGAVQAKLSVWGLVESAFESGNLSSVKSSESRTNKARTIGVKDAGDGEFNFREFE